MKKKRRKTREELLGREYLEQHEKTQRILRERIEYWERRLGRSEDARPER